MKAAMGIRKVLGCIALVFIFALHALGRESLEHLSTEDLLVRLPTIHNERLYDMHGNAHEILQVLMLRRFDATAAICKQLERTDLKEEHVAALFDVLAFVKDPAAIPWLEKQWSDYPERTVEMWLGRRWERYLRGASESELKWLNGADEWAAFFRRRAAEKPEQAHRLKLLRVLAQWFHDEKTIGFFTELERAALDGETLFLAQVYLVQHKRNIEERRTAEAIRELSSSPENAKLLLEYAEELRHEAFVPWLVSIVGPVTKKIEVGNAQWTLEQITFQRDINGQAQWQKWFQERGTEGRQAWLTQAMDEFNQVLMNNPTKAVAILHKAMYRWDDRVLLPYVKQLLQHKKLHNELVGWVNLSYHPYWRKDLQEVAERIVAESRGQLEEWAANLLKELGFLPHKDEPWDLWVRRSNSVV